MLSKTNSLCGKHYLGVFFNAGESAVEIIYLDLPFLLKSSFLRSNISVRFLFWLILITVEDGKVIYSVLKVSTSISK